jgi:hypothetical protein
LVEHNDVKLPNEKISNYNTAYWSLRQFWTDCINLAEPLPNTLAAYLRQYAKEDPDEFAQRVKRIAQINFLDITIDFFVSMLFSTDVQIGSANYKDEVKRFVSSCNLQGDSLIEYFREVVAPGAFLYGSVDLFCDLPSVSVDVVSQAQAQQAGLNAPYCYVVPPINRVAWNLDDSRNYTYYQSEDVINTQVSGGFDLRDKHQFNSWTNAEVAVFDADGKEITTRINPFGFIPAVTVIPLPSKRFHSDRIGKSLVQDVVPLQKLVLNLYSLILDYHEQSNFAQRVIIQDTDNGEEPPEEGELREQGPRRGITLRGKGTKFQMLSPDPAGVQAMCEFLRQVMDMTFRSVFLPPDMNSAKTHQTGQTIRNNQAQLYNRLTQFCRHFEKAMKSTIEMALRVQGIDPIAAGVTVQWDTNFSYEAFISNVEQLIALREALQDLSPTAVKEYAKKVISPQLYNCGKMEAIVKEIDTAHVQGQQTKGKPPTLQQANTEIAAASKIESASEKESY